ncbi:unnamed protein product [Zymoseptoria tritici ST99CH_1A5]|uniref:Uncharacterized protein n=4 Tax=Zymoseptoria tritici TaxID=1047171 RepID=F9X7A1_ZYMTI|nr:uncharacterized protein MYCGRDRAFT_108713 [Zymoseptoria tritici IPO323]SMQ49058.1 unnamed protein product [Zymoseptoria tritici ST99CH_3D7]SMR48876.1 unnamed protein product [Zymoseptoria tritici ST99CH_1E4]SMR50060.1 unnamed protein product [Zymoseptoria tritici ST99CH_3D1]SMY22760.1 unnamed protein product [Zymoseptoria tritici ST99CH_1A5]EGP89305.1 hypothetical protein MYCGRDRAFT_108713 [Zymoseptoria tritici IPO323]
MARSPSDATRFTSTGPYVSNKPAGTTSFTSNPTAPSPSQATNLKFGPSAPANETPQQKIARLRAAAALAKAPQETSWDKTVRRGRIWADRAHRFTALGLIGFTVISAAVATAGITDMMMHNRRRRNEWFAEKSAEATRNMLLAIQAVERGEATEDQVLLINRARVAEQVAEEKKNKPGIFKRAKGWLYGGLSEEEKRGGRLGVVGAVEEAVEERRDGGTGGVLQAVEEKMESSRRREMETLAESINPAGGSLDQRAQLLVDSASNVTSSWFGLGRR